MSETNVTLDSKVKAERKMLVQEIKKLQRELKESQARCKHQKQKISQQQSQVLALMQTNRLLVDMVKSYADREATLLASWRTMQQAFGDAPMPAVVDLDANED